VKQALTAPEVFTRHGVIFELGDLLRKGNPGLALSARRALEDLRDNDDSNKIRLAAAECLARESGETSIAIAAGANAGTAYQLPTVEPSAGKMAPSAGSIESPSIEIASDEGVAEADQRTRWRASTSTAVLCAAAITGVTWELISYVLQLLRLYFGVVLNLAVHGLVYWCCAGLAIAFAFRLFTPVLRKKHIVLIAVAWSLVFAARRIGQESFMSSDLQVFQIWSLASGVVANALAGGITGKVLSAGLGSNQSRGALVGAASFGVSFCLSTIMDSLYGAPATGFLMWYFRRRD
jgi:hypothetical protein